MEREGMERGISVVEGDGKAKDTRRMREIEGEQI